MLEKKTFSLFGSEVNTMSRLFYASHLQDALWKVSFRFWMTCEVPTDVDPFFQVGDEIRWTENRNDRLSVRYLYLPPTPTSLARKTKKTNQKCGGEYGSIYWKNYRHKGRLSKWMKSYTCLYDKVDEVVKELFLPCYLDVKKNVDISGDNSLQEFIFGLGKPLDAFFLFDFAREKN